VALLVANVAWSEDAQAVRLAVASRLGLEPHEFMEVRLLKRSVDGRRRPPVWLANFEVGLDGATETRVLARGISGVRRISDRDQERYPRESELAGAPMGRHPRQSGRVVVVGAGPAGLFAALRLAEAGVSTVLLERGGAVEDRHYSVRRFWRHRELDPESNVVFGEGGAGAFSDGKIYTRRRDGDLGWIFRRLVDFGADPEVMEEGWAHLGTDKLREILPRMRARLRELGAELRFDTRVDGLLVEAGACVGVRLADGELLRAAFVVVACGHSARDTWQMLLDAGAAAEQRPIHIGVRVEHPQRVIDTARYGGVRGDLPPASYRFTSNPRPRRVGGQLLAPARPAHTFCMCPGGTVVAATAQLERVVVNGMSYSKRGAFWANSAIIVEAHAEDYGAADALAGVRFQDRIEAAAFQLGGGDYRAPGQRVSDLLAGKASVDLPRVSHPLGATPSDLRLLLPTPLIEGLVAALRHFEAQLPGFTGSDAVLLAPETRTTAPLRFLRGRNYQSETLPGLLPVGEGAGYAGGIASAALDGLRAADAILQNQSGALSETRR
jgi:uncharacterized protein